MKNYYSILGLERDASITEIRKAYRQRALELHPDVNNNEKANSEFLEISEAYQILKNVNQRKIYNDLFDSKSTRIQNNKFNHFTTRATNNAQKTSKMNADNFKKKTERSAFFDGFAVIIEPIISLFSLF